MSAGGLPAEELERIVDGWIRHALLRDPADFWAWERANAVVRADAEDGWRLVKALVETAPDSLLGGVGAGPLQDLVVRHGPAVIDRVEGRARRDERFRECLAQIWLAADEVPEAVVTRLQQATGNRILVGDLIADDDV
ncbi:MAG TPA: hypothetical protein VNA89_13695 [Gemmatimonadaceae bacterium]|nr:hypothetical protein [Gemmatimonadaceae bacterium]